MLSTNDLRSGLTVNYEDSVYLILEAEHVKQGRGSAFVRVRMKNVKTGATINRTLRAGEKIEQAVIQKREMQYLYASGDEYYFMDTETYDQIPVRSDVLGDHRRRGGTDGGGAPTDGQGAGARKGERGRQH